jgi:serine/threonine-protein kinase
MGTVYLAEDPTIGQQVAIKIVRAEDPDFSDSPSATRAIDRFKQEARAVASLDHLHILPLYRYGEEETASGARAYMVMQYRPEGSLWDWLRRRAGLGTGQSLASVPKLPAGLHTGWPVSLEEAGEYLRQAASALQYAHDRGIVHRDIKPANFLLRLEAGNTVHLLLSDFGLAKFFSSISATSTILGTPIYMAPEQFEGVAGPESDQYALAVMIYQFLAGRCPFEGDPLHLMHQHITVEPPPIRTFVPTLPERIESVLAKALAKKPQARYPSIAAFAAAFAQGRYEKPRSLAPQLSLPALLQDGSNKKRKPTKLLPPSSNPEPLAPYQAEERQPQGPQALPDLLAMQAYDSPTVADTVPGHVNDAAAFTPTMHPTPASLKDVLPPGQSPVAPITLAPQVDGPLPPAQKKVSRRSVLGWVIGGVAAVGIGGAGVYFYTRYRTPPHALSVLRGHSDVVTSVDWSPDGTQLVSGSSDNTARLWYIANAQNTVTYNGHHAAVLSVAWSPNGRLLASGGRDKTVQVWNTTGTLQYNFSGLAAAVSSVTWRLDGTVLFAGTIGNGIHELLLSTNHVTRSAATSTVRAIALSPDQSYLAIAFENAKIAILNMRVNPHKLLAYYSGHTGPVLALAWSPNSAMLASGSADKTARVWDVVTARSLHTLPHEGSVTGVSWDPASVQARLATGCTDKNVSIWDVDSSARTIYSGHGDAVTSVSWGIQGLASGSADHDIIIWQV